MEFQDAIGKAKAEAKEKLVRTLSEATGAVGNPEGKPSRIVRRITTLPSSGKSEVVEEVKRAC